VSRPRRQYALANLDGLDGRLVATGPAQARGQTLKSSSGRFFGGLGPWAVGGLCRDLLPATKTIGLAEAEGESHMPQLMEVRSWRY